MHAMRLILLSSTNPSIRSIHCLQTQIYRWVHVSRAREPIVRNTIDIDATQFRLIKYAYIWVRTERVLVCVCLLSNIFQLPPLWMWVWRQSFSFAYFCSCNAHHHHHSSWCSTTNYCARSTHRLWPTKAMAAMMNAARDRNFCTNIIFWRRICIIYSLHTTPSGTDFEQYYVRNANYCTATVCVPSVSRVFEIFSVVASLCPLLMLLMSQSWSFYLIFIITLHMLMLLARVCVYLSLVVRCTDSTCGKTGQVHMCNMCTCTLFCIYGSFERIWKRFRSIYY